ncbi:MAG: toll/interleukin-1 receptor domain-containing protein [Promethearchaeota archaeon]
MTKIKLDIEYYLPIVTEKYNWENIFSKIFSDKESFNENIEKLRTFKTKLDQNIATLEEIRESALYIYSITNCFSKSFNIFLSYSTKDSNYFTISEIAKNLELYPEIDRVFYWEADSGEDVVDYMERTLKISQVFILFCTRNATKSKSVKGEWKAAYQLGKTKKVKIIPIYENQEYVPTLLMPKILVEFTKENFKKFIETLYKEILRK